MPDTSATVMVRPARYADRDQWAQLFRDYRRFYGYKPDEDIVERVWSWIHDPTHELRALLAETADHRVVGLAHYRRFTRPSTGTTGIFLDDLYTDPQRRRTGIGRAVLDRLAAIAAQEHHTVIRWITAQDNETAQRLYDTLADRTTWLTYDLDPTSHP